ncbi:DUF4054 domain-containing protein [Patescibacteria group bacterium]|nr:DUF4054 domain-containing protein [Patescibacteria group bacterium]
MAKQAVQIPEPVAQMPKKMAQTPEFRSLLESGYQMTIEKAETIIKERDAEPTRWPYELYEKAQALLAAWNASPRVISKRPGWKRQRIPV